ncbi:MAG: DUF3467 domain-containing protein [Cystobacterineae bacterium]|nr:DUF3467 domain-containing protein [Cystobacterineae bacterium]
MSEEAPPPEVQLQIVLDEQVANGLYCNMALINLSETEFTLDFLFIQPQQNRAKVLSRIITSPKHMKRLLATFKDSLARYEAKYGPIEADEGHSSLH